MGWAGRHCEPVACAVADGLPPVVIPAKAGTQGTASTRWAPAYAGVTEGAARADEKGVGRRDDGDSPALRLGQSLTLAFLGEWATAGRLPALSRTGTVPRFAWDCP